MSAIPTTAVPVTSPETPHDPAPSPGRIITSVLDWPSGLRPTTLRQAWFVRFQTLEAGLSLKQVAERLAEPYASAAFWAKCFNYPFTKLARGRKSHIDWNTVDWSLKNCELARQLGVTGERVRQIRLARNLPPTQRHSDGGKQFRAFVAANRRRLHRWSIRQMIVESGATISTATAHTILKKTNVRLRQHFIPWEHVNWGLPDRDLAKAWHTTSTYVCKVRAAMNVGGPQWIGTPMSNDRDPAFRRLLAREVKKAQTSRRGT